MNRHKRPVDAVLPTATRPQLVHIGRRRRIDHLSKHARVVEGTMPCGLRNETRERHYSQDPGSSSKGLAYRNSVFQALLNTPMFVNFVRMHSRRWHPSATCPVHPSCLTCAMAELAARYWQNSYVSEAFRTEHVALGCTQLWDLCLKTFWPRSTPMGRVGPSNLEDEFYSDTFLLNFLKEMRAQLERSPSEYQTFEQMFSVHTVCRWKCNARSCGWTSAPYKWESSLFLDLAVQRPQPKSRQTPVLIGIERALRTKTRVNARRASTPHQERCGRCRKPTESFTDIVNLPELLIVIRDIEELLPGDEPDIPFRQELNMSGLASGPDNALDPKTYELICGIAENRYSPLVSRDCAFARAPRDSGDKWFCILDEVVRPTDFGSLEKLQRSVSDGGLADGTNVSPICPEIFIYRLKDYDQRSSVIDTFGPVSPLNDNTIIRNAIANTISDIFTQKIGKGLLKFKVKISPENPGSLDNDTIEVDLKLSYEVDGKHYGIVDNKRQNFLAFQLKPLQQIDVENENAQTTPYEGRAVDRAVRRSKGVYPESNEQAGQQTNGLVELPAQPVYQLPHIGQNPFSHDSMDIDPLYEPGRGAKNTRGGKNGQNHPNAQEDSGNNRGGNGKFGQNGGGRNNYNKFKNTYNQNGKRSVSDGGQNNRGNKRGRGNGRGGRYSL